MLEWLVSIQHPLSLREAVSSAKRQELERPRLIPKSASFVICDLKKSIFLNLIIVVKIT